ncbi:MAG: ATP-binding protein [Pseudomonadota bacterium]|nr:ATP-binding protein [Pseudomonadota bacterium]
MQQVFPNLLNNASQYPSDDRPVAMVARGEAQAVVVTVSKHGPVISPKALKKIFDPRVRLSQDNRERALPSTSLGLGLFIAREITEGTGQDFRRIQRKRRHRVLREPAQKLAADIRHQRGVRTCSPGGEPGQDRRPHPADRARRDAREPERHGLQTSAARCHAAT